MEPSGNERGKSREANCYMLCYTQRIKITDPNLINIKLESNRNVIKISPGPCNY